MADQGTHLNLNQEIVKSGAIDPGWKFPAFDDSSWAFPTLASPSEVVTPGWPNLAAIKYDPPYEQAYYRRWMTPDYNGAGRMYLVAEVDTEVRVWLDGDLIIEKPSGVTGVVEAQAWYSDANPKQLAVAVFGGGSWAWEWRREWDGSGASIRRTYDPNIDSPVDPWFAHEAIESSGFQVYNRPSQHWGDQLWHQTPCGADEGATPETPEITIQAASIQVNVATTETRWQLQSKWASLSALVYAQWHNTSISLAGLQLNVGNYVVSNLGVDVIAPGFLDADVTNTKTYLNKISLSVIVDLAIRDIADTITRLTLSPAGVSYNLLRPPGGAGIFVQPESFESGQIDVDPYLFVQNIDHTIAPGSTWNVPCPGDTPEVITYVAYVWDGFNWQRARSKRSMSIIKNEEWQEVGVLNSA